MANSTNNRVTEGRDPMEVALSVLRGQSNKEPKPCNIWGVKKIGRPKVRERSPNGCNGGIHHNIKKWRSFGQLYITIENKVRSMSKKLNAFAS